jgi:predicted CXXCH cytochrome family protein
MKRTAVYILSLLSLALIPGTVATHVGSVFLPEGCGSCHVGHGLSNEPMLSASEEEACYQCHGSSDQQSRMISSGRLAPAASPADIKREFEKPYRHPVESSGERGEHLPNERLPNFSKTQTTHAECVDCHNPHQRAHQGIGLVDKVAGYSLSGQYLEEATREYEICLKCHSEVIGGPSNEDIRSQFVPGVRSMHPVTRPSTGTRQVSLKSSDRMGATMACSDCHRSDDPDGPRGPHGSMYEFMLSGNYSTSSKGDESPLSYQFCYSCHERSSILNNESFPLHREHILGDPFSNIPGTSCYTCHASHSSEKNPHLIRFNRQVVNEVQPGNRIEYRALGERSGECYLTCHGQTHNPAQY